MSGALEARCQSAAPADWHSSRCWGAAALTGTMISMGHGKLTRHSAPDPQIVEQAQGLRFLVLDELHTYRGRQGADVAMLVRRVRERLNLNLLCVGTSATMASEGTVEDRNTAVATIASRLFGTLVRPTNIITETLERVTPDDVRMDGATLAAALRTGLP